MDKLTLLISSAGRRVELIHCFRKAARQLGLDFTVIAVDIDPSWSPACQVADYSYQVPRCTAEEFPRFVRSLCEKHAVRLIIPTIDTELLVYAKNRALFSEIGTEVLGSSEDFIQIARDKEATAEVLEKNGIPVPRTWTYEEIMSGSMTASFPLFLKPKGGSCSKGISVVEDKETLLNLHPIQNQYILQEICTGREYTINCFYDRSGACRSCVPHHRQFVRDGEVCFAETERVPAFKEIAHKLSKIFEGIWGSVCFQGFIAEDGNVKIFEINARFGGGYPICDYAGGSFAKWLLQDLIGQEPDYHDNWREGVRMLRYDTAVYTEPPG